MFESSKDKGRLVVLIVMVIFSSACGEAIDDPQPAAAESPRGKSDIYGEDDRAETFAAVAGPEARRFARASAMLAESSNFAENVDERGEIVGYRLADEVGSLGEIYGLCDGERFVEQPVVGFCSATLVAPDLVATSGHCIGSEGASADEALCEGVRIIFDFAYTSADDDHFAVFNNMPVDSVYACERVEAFGFHSSPVNEDWALIRLDRPVVGREPVPVLSTRPRIDSPVLQIGHPTGIPQKIAPGKVTNRRDFSQAEVFLESTFTYDADLFGGNSGGGVFDLENGALAGIPTLFSGQDYLWDDARMCSVTGVCGENTSCPFPPGGYGTFDIVEKLRQSGSPLLDELVLIEGEVDPPTPAVDAKLFFSEYVEGSGWNKALEIFNPSESAVDAGNCSVRLYSNGSFEPTASYSLEGEIEGLGTLVVCDTRSEIPDALCDARVGFGFNGDDALVLECSGFELDAFGEVGVDPGDAWVNDEGASIDHTLRRMCQFTSGTIEFDLLEWVAHDIDDFTGLGEHRCR